MKVKGENTDVIVVASGKWPSILMSLGCSEKSMSGKHSPCPVCEGKDRFRVIDPEGAMRWVCTHCGSGDGMNLAQEILNCTFQEAAEKIRPMVGGASFASAPKKPDQYEMKRRIKRLMDMWRSAKDRDIVKSYMAMRGLPREAHEMADLRGGMFKYYEDKKYIDERPTMIARITTPMDRSVCLHRTAIDGTTWDKKMTPTSGPWTGGAIRLFKQGESETLIIAEGIETVLAARYMLKERSGHFIPAWATVNANGMRKFAPPEGINRVVIMSDNDRTYVGQSAAYDLAHRLVVRNKIQADVFVPKKTGQDWLDVYLEEVGA